MMMDTKDFHRLLIERSTFFCFSGPLSESALSAISDAVKNRVFEASDKRPLATKIFAIFIEQAQNIIRYSAESIAADDEIDAMGIGTVAISGSDVGFIIEAVNPIHPEIIPRLEKNLIELQAMSGDELKVAYTERLKSGPPEGSKGAGLGFIQMARKCDRFKFKFAKDDEGSTLFIFKVEIDK
mgnify:FL=1|jgi:hypothetical protein|tara:strand:- start:1273 stop:1821 length:549 start_codon:yes stop_codon:yes gene_type:complete